MLEVLRAGEALEAPREREHGRALAGLAALLGEPGGDALALAPGLVKTDMARALWEGNEESVGKFVTMQRLGEPDDIANAALFLASDAASWICGHTLVVDGGMLL